MSTFQNDMNNEFKRYATFSGFRSPDGVWPLQLAQAGFYRSGTCQDFQVVCFACGLVLDLRNVDRDPLIEIHRRLSPECSFVGGSSNNEPVPPVNPAAALEWLSQNFSYDVEPVHPWTVQYHNGDSVSNLPASLEATSSPNELILPEHFSLSHIASQLPSLSDLNTLEQSDYLPSLPMDFIDGFANTTLNSVPTAALFQGGDSSLPQNQFGSILGGPGEVLVTDGEGVGMEGSYPDPRMADPEISHFSNKTQKPADPGEVVEPIVHKKLTYGDLGIITPRPKRPEFSTVQKRLDTFRKWMGPRISQTKEKITEAGFYYAGYSDCCRCFYCGGGLKSWEPEDDPWIEHARWFKDCPFILINKGKEFVQAVHSLARTNKTVLMPDVKSEVNRISSSDLPSLCEDPCETEMMDTQSQEDGNIANEAERLIDENMSLTQPELCKICLDKEVGVVYVPCGHLVTCGTCASTVDVCPVCRESIGGQIRIQRED